MESIGSTIGRIPKLLSQIASEEVRLASEKHSLSYSGNQEALEIVLTRPLPSCNFSEILKVSQKSCLLFLFLHRHFKLGYSSDFKLGYSSEFKCRISIKNSDATHYVCQRRKKAKSPAFWHQGMGWNKINLMAWFAKTKRIQTCMQALRFSNQFNSLPRGAVYPCFKSCRP